MFTIQAKETDCTRLRFSASSRYLLVGDGCEVWELPPGKAALYGDNVPCGVEWQPKKAELYVPIRHLGLDVLSPTGKRLQRVTKAIWKTSWVRGMAFSPSGDWLVTYEPYQLTGLRRVRDSWQVKWSEKVEKAKWYSPGDSFESVAPFPDNRRIVTLVSRTLPHPKKGKDQAAHGGYAELLVQRDLTTGKVLSERELLDKERPLGVRTRLSVTPDGLAIIGFRGRSVYVWPTDADDAKTRKTTVAKKDVRDVALHPSGRWVLTVCADSDVSVWDTTTWKSARTFNWRIGSVQSVGFSPDGALAAAGSENCKVVVWDWDL